LAEYANVTPELLQAVFEQNEELRGVELWKLCRFFENSGRQMHNMYGYLSAPKQVILNPDANKTRYRVKLLQDAVTEVEKCISAGGMIGTVEQWSLDRANRIIEVLTVTRKQPVGYAFYWWALHWTQQTAYKFKPKNPRGLTKKVAV
jgi:hypothetical protein